MQKCVSYLQCPQRQRSIHPDDEFPTVWQKKTDPEKKDVAKKISFVITEMGKNRKTYFSPEHNNTHHG